MSPEQLQQKIDSLAPWFHCIDLGGGVKTKTHSAAGEPVDHPLETWQKIGRCLPADLAGKSVLDVGCNAGFYAIEAKRRGAARVLGVDAQRHHVRQALFVRRVLGLDIDYRRMSVYDLSRKSIGQFDITLALGLIYHCKHLILALEKLYEVTKELLIIETAILPQESLAWVEEQASRGADETWHPLAYTQNLPERKEHVFNWFLPGLDALQAILTDVGFDEVNVFDLKKDRAILTVQKKKPASEGTVLSQLHAQLALAEGPKNCARSSPIRFQVQLENSGGALWKTHSESDERGTVRLGAHLLDLQGDDLIWDYGRAAIGRDLGPDEKSSVWIELTAPSTSGSYIVEFDLVLEHITWFEDLGTNTIRHQLLVN